MDEHIKLVEKWIDDPDSVSQETLKDYRKTAKGNVALALDWAIDGYRGSAEYYVKQIRGDV